MKIRIYYEDTDCGNVVYYANYLKYMERGRTEFMREEGLELENFHKQGFIFAVSDVAVKYRRPARYNDLIEVKTILTEITSVRLTFETKIYNEKNKLLVSGTAKMVCIDSKTGRATKGPSEMIEQLKKKYG